MIDKENIKLLKIDLCSRLPYSQRVWTDEERDEWCNASYQAALEVLKKKELDNTPNALVNVVSLDWLSVHHFDYNSLIEKGLALIAPEGMYETE